MIHKYCIRTIIKTGETSKVEFGEIDGAGVDRRGEFERDGGLTEHTALLVVNKWNYVATLQSRVEYAYYLPAVETPTMTKFRQHRGGYAESMATVVNARTFADLDRIVNGFLAGPSTKGRITVKPYSSGVDSRNGWDTHVVMLDGGVVGFTDGMPQ